jgi:hypothetical protein
MKTLDRRRFLWLVPGPLLAVVAAPLLPTQSSAFDSGPSIQDYPVTPATNSGCWLDVCAPFVVEDPERNIHSEIILTSDTFAGRRGYSDGADKTDYEIYLYDATGRPVGANGLARKLTVPAMQTTVLSARSLLGEDRSFWGGMRIRLRPQVREPMHASDLFSSAFVRWLTPDSFDNVHANPDPLEWQKAESFYYSMPFPPLADYECIFSFFNPYDSGSAGSLRLNDHAGNKLVDLAYDLKPYASFLFSVNTGEFCSDARQAFCLPEAEGMAAAAEKLSSSRSSRRLTEGGGMLAITNSPGSQKGFGYLLIRQANRRRFSVEHPIHQGVFKSRPAVKPFEANGNFAAKNVLFSPLLFRGKRVGKISFESRFHLSTGLPLEEAMWFNLFATDGDGNVPWLSAKDPKLAALLPATQIEHDAIRLNAGQSCVLDFSRLSVQGNFSGGLSLAIAPDSTHTLMKVEIRIPEWGAHAFTHFRPGLRAARGYQKPKQRGGLATDYIISGARVARREAQMLFDELIGIINIDDRAIEARPVLELFNSRGLLERIQLGSLPGFATRHYLLSELTKETTGPAPVSVRLVDERATLLMSAVHLDYGRRDIALDHGSDRFSTFVDYDCDRAT